jgi:hypothetical protein
MLAGWARRNPESGMQVRAGPLRIRWAGCWQGVREIRALGAALEVIGRNGRRIRLPEDAVGMALHREARSSLAARIRQVWPEGRVLHLTTELVGHRSRPGSLGRALVRRTGWPRSDWLALVLDASAPQDAPWLVGRLVRCWDRSTLARGAALIIPDHWSDYIAEILSRLRFPVECWRVGAAGAQRIYPRERGDLECRSPYRVLPLGSEICPGLIRGAEASPKLDLVFRKSRWEVSLRGFPVLWQEPEGLVFDRYRPRLLRENWGAWIDYIAVVSRRRCDPPPDPRDPIYRYAPERWLEAHLIRDLKLIRPDLGGEVYCQVPTLVEGDRKVIDLLGATRSGRLVVVELKARQDSCLLFQGIEYWQRVWDHLRHGDFETGGYFPGLALSREPPILYLVSPWLEFHRQLALFRSYVAAEVEVRCLGINADWRRGLRIIRRFRL